jgi:hypothetical protein
MKPEYKYLMRTTYSVALPRGMLIFLTINGVAAEHNSCSIINYTHDVSKPFRHNGA